MRTKFTLIVLAWLVATPAVAQDAEAVVTYRQSIYQVMKWQFGAIRGMLVGDRDYQAEDVAQAADFLAQTVTLLPTAYAAGSITGDSAALPKIWEQWADFEDRLGTLAEETATLAALDAGDRDAITEQFQAVGGVCKDCHDNYKKD